MWKLRVRLMLLLHIFIMFGIIDELILRTSIIMLLVFLSLLFVRLL